MALPDPCQLAPAEAVYVAYDELIDLVEAKIDCYWFLSFASSLYEDRNDYPQGGMVAKVYAFLHDFLPHGFTGKWSHIKGNSLMEILLSDIKTFSVTRHKVISKAAEVFKSMEEWMKKGSDWKEAAKQAGLDGDKTDTAAGSAKKKGAKKPPPFLYSPEGMVAFLVISYPNSKYLQWIGRLQIAWMITWQPDQPLSVEEGFWKGITDENLLMF